MQAQAQPPPTQPIRTKIIADAILQKFPTTTIDYVRERRLKVTTTPEAIKELALYIRDDLVFDHISCVSGTDWIAKNEIEVIYFVGTASRPGYEDLIIGLAERAKRESPVVPSLIQVWGGVEYHERETHEMLGVEFVGHPNSKHLLLPEDWDDIPPLRKDYVSPGR